MTRFPWRAVAFLLGVALVSAVAIAVSILAGPPQTRIIPVPETHTVPTAYWKEDR